MPALKPRSQTPLLEVATLGDAQWRLADVRARTFVMVLVYRGYHCPICKTYLADLARRLPEFRNRGTEVLAVSTDSQERARKSREEWALGDLTIGYGLAIEQARGWGLYISRAIKESEPAEFAEPGLFLIRPDRTLYWASIQTMPFARPSFGDVLNAIDFVVKNNYPARGEA